MDELAGSGRGNERREVSLGWTAAGCFGMSWSEGEKERGAGQKALECVAQNRLNWCPWPVKPALVRPAWLSVRHSEQTGRAKPQCQKWSDCSKRPGLTVDERPVQSVLTRENWVTPLELRKFSWFSPVNFKRVENFYMASLLPFSTKNRDLKWKISVFEYFKIHTNIQSNSTNFVC